MGSKWGLPHSGSGTRQVNAAACVPGVIPSRVVTVPAVTKGCEHMSDEGKLDPWVKEWLEAHTIPVFPFPELTPDLLELLRSPTGAPAHREIAKVTDDVVEDVPVRFYEHDHAPAGLIVYFHGGAFCIGSVAMMDNVARELAHCSDAVVISVEYRLAPEHPYPAGLDDCEKITRWALANASRFGASPEKVVVAGESAGGNLSAAVTLRLRGNDPPLAGQVLMYPGLDGWDRRHPSREQFDGLIIDTSTGAIGKMYTGGKNLDDDPFVAPLRAESLAGLPPAIVVLGGCDPLRDEGRLYARRLHDEGVEVEEICFAGQPHGFMNLEFPAAADAIQRIGAFLRSVFAAKAL